MLRLLCSASFGFQGGFVKDAFPELFVEGQALLRVKSSHLCLIVFVVFFKRQVVSAEQSFHRRLAEYEMTFESKEVLGKCLQVLVTSCSPCLGAGATSSHPCFFCLACDDTTDTLGPPRNIEQQKLFREEHNRQKACEILLKNICFVQMNSWTFVLDGSTVQ